MCLPRSIGGLGVLNPSVQVLRLQWRWLVPPLLGFSSCPLSLSLVSASVRISVPYSKFLLHQFSSLSLPPSQTPSYLWPPLFPSHPPTQLTKIIFNPFQALFVTVDSLLSFL